MISVVFHGIGQFHADKFFAIFLFIVTQGHLMQILQDKVAIVTGASRGIGAHIATMLAQAGAKVIVNYADNQLAADKVVSAIEQAGGSAFAVQADVSRPAQATALFDAAIARFGKVDILVNNAGILFSKKLQDTGDDEFDRIFSINVKGVFNLLRESATRLQDGGRIVNISNSMTRMLMPVYGAYAATKCALEQLTRTFAKEVGARNITVNAISPGPTNTPLFHQGKPEAVVKHLASMAAFGRIGEPEDIARVVRFLSSDEAGWITGQNLPANGGLA
jgi:3-oxoacyl-[acyl-carrier protein] reductase